MTDKRQFRPTHAEPAGYPRSDEIARDRRAFLTGVAAAIAGAMVGREALGGSSIIPGKKSDKKQDPKGKARGVPPPPPPGPRPPPDDPGYAQLPEAAVDELGVPAPKKKTKKDQKKTKRPEVPPRRTQGVPPLPDRDDRL